jgi:hypothetical protein
MSASHANKRHLLFIAEARGIGTSISKTCSPTWARFQRGPLLSIKLAARRRDRFDMSQGGRDMSDGNYAPILEKGGSGHDQGRDETAC